MCAVAFLPTHIGRIIFTLVSFNLKLLAIFKIYFHFFPFDLEAPFQNPHLCEPNQILSQWQNCPRIHQSWSLFSEETSAHFLQSLPQALTTRKLASNVVTNLDPAGDFSTMEVTMSPMVALRIETRLYSTLGSICWPFNPYSGPRPGPQAYADGQVLYTALYTFPSLS